MRVEENSQGLISSIFQASKVLSFFFVPKLLEISVDK